MAKILVIGGGGREHALVYRLAQSNHVSKIFCAPGNAGIANIAECVPIPADDVTALQKFAKSNKIDLTVVGPEAPLAAGIVDSFKRQGLKIFGPSKEAATLESSKVFAKDFCNRYNIPTAKSEIFDNAEAARAYAHVQEYPIVVKADGLASGKGVIICKTSGEAEEAIDEILVQKKFGEAGKKLVIEEFLAGEEVSFIAISDGNHVLPLVSSQDHKAVFDGDLGPNTGGMGAISPARIMENGLTTTVMERIMLPTVRGMVTEGMPFVGVLYAGLMIKNGEPFVLEYNVRFGDPETEPLMMRLKSDLYEVLNAAVTGTLHDISLEWDARPAACVVMASGGYPGAYEKGKTISGLGVAEKVSDVCMFHAGTKCAGKDIVTDGGRVLAVTALGDDICDAVGRAYAAVECIHFEGAHYRKDIGRRNSSSRSA